MNRRFILNGLVAAPFVIRIAGLLMPVRAVAAPFRSVSLITVDGEISHVAHIWYERQELIFSPPSKGMASNSQPIMFTCASSTYVERPVFSVGIHDQKGKLLRTIPLTMPIMIGMGSSFSIPTGQLTVPA